MRTETGGENVAGRARRLICRAAWFVAAVLILAAVPPTAWGQAGEEVEALLLRAETEGWTFTVDESAAGGRTLDELCSLVEPDGWWVGAPFDAGNGRLGLPTSFDWRALGGCTPIRDQGACGSCWAFGTVGPLECNILIRDGDTVDLSEQWLVSCNREGYGCGGGWWVHQYHQSTTDSCGGTGAVLESAFPYTAQDSPCGCPYAHPYVIDGWAYIGTSYGIPSTDAIKQAIMTYGPVSVAIRVNSAFQYYSGGVFNSSATGSVNHGVVLVGWDDDLGTNGVWILRNSWGPGWGDAGYMYIEYGCSSIGYAACYVDYPGVGGPRIEVTPSTLNLGSVNVGSDTTGTVSIKNVGGEALTGSAAGLNTPFSIDGSADYSLAPGATQVMTIRFAPTLQGSYSDTIVFSGGGGDTVTVSGIGTGSGPADNCAAAPAISDGTFTGSNDGAGTSIAAGCGGGGSADVWWRYQVPRDGVLVADTCGSDFDTVLSLYDACGGNELACNDDDASCAPGSLVELAVTTGDVVYVRVARVGVLQAGHTNVQLNIETTAPPRTISGRVTTAGATPVAGVTLTGLTGEPVTDVNGDYTATVPYSFTGTARPSKTAYTFAPTSRTYTDVTNNLTGQDYVAIPPTFVIAGRITDQANNPVTGVLLSGLPGNPLTNSSGVYQTSVDLGFSGTVTPVKAGCTFTPSSRTYANVSADRVEEDYDGTQPVGTLRVNIEPAAARDAGALWCVDEGSWQASGTALINVPAGAHTVSYHAVTGWTEPLTDVVVITGGATTTLSRTYTQSNYELMLVPSPANAGTITPAPLPSNGDTYLQDTVVTLTATPAPGYRVAWWSGADLEPASGSLSNTVTVDRTRTVVVQFEVMPFSSFQLVGRVARGEGWISPTHGAYAAGSVVELVATPGAGFVMGGWSGTDDDDSLDERNTVTMNGHRSVSVTFVPWVDCNENGVADALDITLGLRSDCNANDIPDDCEPDTDGDGIIDDCEGDDGLDPVQGIGAPVGGGSCGFGAMSTLALTLAGLGVVRLRRRG
ncbi:MAG: C1 family peptidase [Phycisphaerae bacterium]